MVNIWIVRGASGGVLIPEYLKRDRMAIGLRGTKDFRLFKTEQAIKDHILSTHKGGDPSKKFYGTRGAGYGLQFYSKIKQDDLVVLARGADTVVAIGTNIGDYNFYENPEWQNKEADYQHMRKVNWFMLNKDFELPQIPSQIGFSRIVDKDAISSLVLLCSHIEEEAVPSNDEKSTDWDEVAKLIREGAEQFIKKRSKNRKSVPSWTSYSLKVVVVEMDETCFQRKRILLAENIRGFFELSENQGLREVQLNWFGEKFSATLEPGSGRSYASIKLDDTIVEKVSEFLPQYFGGFASPADGGHPKAEIRFEKIQRDEFEIEFLVPEEIDGNTDPEQDLDEEVASRLEGLPKTVVATRYERDPKNRIEAIRIHGLKCSACGFDFARAYGERGQGYIEIHHIKLVSEAKEAEKVNPLTDLVPVCSNCHRMIHRRKGSLLTVDQLKEILDEQKR